MSKTTQPAFITVGASIINLSQIRRIYYDDKENAATILYTDDVTDKIPLAKQDFLNTRNKILSNQFFEI